MTGALGGLPQWPADGVLRVHLDPAAFPQVGDGIGHNRFDDPRPRTADRYVVRYAATTLRGCLLELLDWLRPAQEAIAREAAVTDGDTAPAQADQAVVGQALADYLAGRRIGRITATNPVVVSINDPTLQAELDGEPAVRALLDSPLSRQTFLPDRSLGDRRVHLDQAAVRLGSELGRDLTRACSLALRDRQDRPDVIHYRSRHDDREDCWAIYDHAAVRVGHIRPLSPEDRAPAGGALRRHPVADSTAGALGVTASRRRHPATRIEVMPVAWSTRPDAPQHACTCKLESRVRSSPSHAPTRPATQTTQPAGT